MLKEWEIASRIEENSHNVCLDLVAKKISYVDGLGNEDVVPIRKKQVYNFEDLAGLKQIDRELWNITEKIRHMQIRVNIGSNITTRRDTKK